MDEKTNKRPGRKKKLDVFGNPIVKVKPVFEMRILKVLKSWSIDPKNRIDMMICRWKLASEANLEKRRIFILPDGSERILKQVSLTAEDIRFIVSNQQEITQILEANREWKE